MTAVKTEVQRVARQGVEMWRVARQGAKTQRGGRRPEEWAFLLRIARPPKLPYNRTCSRQRHGVVGGR